MRCVQRAHTTRRWLDTHTMITDAAASLIDKSAVIGGQASTARKLESADGARPGTGHGASAADAGVGGGADDKK